ncbi:unnamed protein product [Echinostoma caproni]|uniref:HIG1 domain-containing protein n=1 Tax=Echinostoma caproni TaxID=27848 RepID=A0A183ACA5_9TREM|nr:unnamed protein product [Echinostoma caproni]
MSENETADADKGIRVLGDYPVLLAGVVFTGFALFNGLRLSRMPLEAIGSQRMMRWRIYGQGGTLALASYIAAVSYNYVTSKRSQ